MPAAKMFSKYKSGTPIPQTTIDGNPISQYFEIGKQVACAGPELIWKIHEGYKKSDRKECSIFIFDKRCAEKLHKPKRKETVTELLRASVKQLERFKHPKILQVNHSIEECPELLAFATEPILASLSNILAFQETTGYTISGGPTTGASQVIPSGRTLPRLPHAIEYKFLDMEMKYGLLQLTEALTFLHYTGHVIHRNVCPSSILITKRGTWKLAGFEFIEKANETDPAEPIPCQPWSSRASKMTQPNLDYIAPEIQLQSNCSILSDMFSLGMLICAIFNNGIPLILAGNSPSSYTKQLDMLEDSIHNMLPRIPIPLQEATSRLTFKEPALRPTAQLLQLIKYFSDPGVSALQYLDVINMKDTTQKSHFYKVTLREVLPGMPRKILWQHIWPCLQQELNTSDVLAAALQSILALIQQATPEEYETIILPGFRTVFAVPKSIQATVTILEYLHIILEKSPNDEIRSEVLALLYNSLESTTPQVQCAAIVAVMNAYESLDATSVRKMVLPKLKLVFDKNQNDKKLIVNILQCIEKTMDKMDRVQIMDVILPLIFTTQLVDPDVITRVLTIYRIMLNDKKYKISITIMATKILPILIPLTVYSELKLEQFTLLLEVSKAMLDQIDRQQRNKLKLDNLRLVGSPEQLSRTLRHQYSSDNMSTVAPFNIPNLKIDQRKTSSAEDMARKNSITGVLGGWWFGGGSPSGSDSNFLRVSNAFPNRRLSDNTLMTPKIRIAPSCASSPGGTSGGGLPIRRHSSIGPQERRNSTTINLSPPTSGSMPNTSSSVPFLLSSSMQSIRSRRPSTSLSSGPLGSGSGLLQQLGSGMVRQLVSGSGAASPVHHHYMNGNNINTRFNYVRKCPSLNITFTD